MKWVSIQDFGEASHDGIPELMFAQLDNWAGHLRPYRPPLHRAVPEGEEQARIIDHRERFWGGPPFENAGKPCKQCGKGRAHANGYCCQICEIDAWKDELTQSKIDQERARQEWARERARSMEAKTELKRQKEAKREQRRLKREHDQNERDYRSWVKIGCPWWGRDKHQARYDAEADARAQEKRERRAAKRQAIRDLIAADEIWRQENEDREEANRQAMQELAEQSAAIHEAFRTPGDWAEQFGAPSEPEK